MMNKNRKQKRIGFLLLILLLVAVTGCGKKETPTTTAMKQETTKEETTKEETTASSGKAESKEKYTVEEVAQDIEFDGKKISLPTTLKELGDEYCWSTYIEPTQSEEKNYFIQSIMYKDTSMNKGKEIYIFLGTATFQSTDGVAKQDSKICSMLVLDSSLNHEKFSIKGVKIGDSLEEVRKVFGKEDYVKQEDKDTCYSYGAEESNHFDFGFKNNNTDKITYIRIRFEK